MRSWLKVLAAFFCILLTSCDWKIGSQVPLFQADKIARILPDNFAIVSDYNEDDSFRFHFDDGYYSLDTSASQVYFNAFRFRLMTLPREGSYAVEAQISTTDRNQSAQSPYIYFFINYKSGSLEILEFPENIQELLSIYNKKNESNLRIASDEIIGVTSADSIIKLFSFITMHQQNLDILVSYLVKPSDPAPSWNNKIYTDKFTDQRRYIMSTVATKTDNYDGSVELGISCVKGDNGKGDITVWLNWGVPIQDVFPESPYRIAIVDVRFDKGRPERYGFFLTSDQKEGRSPSGNHLFGGAIAQIVAGLGGGGDINFTWDAVDFLQRIISGEELLVRSQDIMGKEIVSTFNLSGTKDAATKMVRACTDL